jgi:hypothetical protein
MFADAGPGARRSTFMGRHPQTFTDLDMIHMDWLPPQRSRRVEFVL